MAGDFQSVGLEEAASKLEKVVGDGVSKSALQTFRDVGKHRNKMVHFFHEAHSTSEDEQLRTEIAKEQLNAWYLLNQLLTGPWKDVFDDWLAQISEIDTRLRDPPQVPPSHLRQLEAENGGTRTRGIQVRGLSFMPVRSARTQSRRRGR